MPGWERSDRRQRLPENWPAIRRRILIRDQHRCTVRDLDGKRCPEPATDVDHIRPGDDHSDHNLRAICEWHHDRKSGHEGGQAAAKARARHRRKFNRQEAHPGALA